MTEEKLRELIEGQIDLWIAKNFPAIPKGSNDYEKISLVCLAHIAENFGENFSENLKKYTEKLPPCERN